MPNMSDREVTITDAVAVGLWLIGAAIIVVDFIVPVELLAVSMYIVGVAMCVTIRGYIRRAACREVEREKAAFVMGREYESGRMRSVN